MKNLYNKDETMMSVQLADLSYGIVFQLLLSAIVDKAMVNQEAPQVGDWCIELSTISCKEPKLLGIVQRIIPDGYVTLTVLGQQVTWTNCRMLKIPSTLLPDTLHTELLALLEADGADIRRG